MSTRYAVGLPTVGDFGDPDALVALAVLAEESGWHGVYLWDHVLYHDQALPVVNTTVTAGRRLMARWPTCARSGPANRCGRGCPSQDRRWPTG